MDISPWIKKSDRRPTQADLPVELFFGNALPTPMYQGPVVAEHLTGAPTFGRTHLRAVSDNETFTHWRPYRPLTPAQLEVKDTTPKSKEAGGAGPDAFVIAMRSASSNRFDGPKLETIALEIEAYAKQKADEAVKAATEVKDTEIKGQGYGGASTKAFHLAMRCARLDHFAYPKFETIALEIEAYAKDVANKAVEDHKKHNVSNLERRVDALQRDNENLKRCRDNSSATIRTLEERMKQAEAAKREAEGKVSGQLFTIGRLEGQVADQRRQLDLLAQDNRRQLDTNTALHEASQKLRDELKQVEEAKREAEGRLATLRQQLENQAQTIFQDSNKIDALKREKLQLQAELFTVKEQIKQATTVEPANSLQGENAASLEAFNLVRRAQSISGSPFENRHQIETVARELEQYAQDKAKAATKGLHEQARSVDRFDTTMLLPKSQRTHRSWMRGFKTVRTFEGRQLNPI